MWVTLVVLVCYLRYYSGFYSSLSVAWLDVTQCFCSYTLLASSQMVTMYLLYDAPKFLAVDLNLSIMKNG
jgi:hypothetical protein